MKPELLIPVGNPEALYAAIEGGANAVYFGLNKFSARARADNFSLENILSILSLTKKNKIKTYVTINTLLKNEELKTLLDIFHSLSYFGVDAVIIQDWGVYHLLKKHFPKLEIHASTQMGIHNSIGADFAKKKEFKRVILARDITMSELKNIANNTDIELEIFVHGSLCYSFSGYCLFSSYLGGMSANRGECRQPCRRKYSGNIKDEFLFSLKDLQLIDYIPEFINLGISSFKIEGRMKSSDYVLNTAKAYRLAIDNPDKIDEAKEILKLDTGREKTSYFFGNKVNNAISQNSYTGIHAGKVIFSQKDNFTFKTHLEISEGNRLRIMPASGENSSMIKVRQILNIEKEGASSIVTIPFKDIKVNKEDKVFLVGYGKVKFKSKLPYSKPTHIISLPKNRKEMIINSLYEKTKIQKKEIYTKIDQLNWMPKIHMPLTDYLVINLSKKEWKLFLEKESFINRFNKKIIASLPVFISEDNIKYYSDLINKLYKLGIKNFMIGHFSQILLFKNKNDIKAYTDENVYSLNDAAIKSLKNERIKNFVTPFENDLDNLLKGSHRNGILPVYFYPRLFYSRMPVNPRQGNKIQDRDKSYNKIIRDGITIVIPDKPVILFHHKETLVQNGFSKFLIDLSFTDPSKHTFQRLIKRLQSGISEQPSTQFNFKRKLN